MKSQCPCLLNENDTLYNVLEYEAKRMRLTYSPSDCHLKWKKKKKRRHRRDCHLNMKNKNVFQLPPQTLLQGSQRGKMANTHIN